MKVYKILEEIKELSEKEYAELRMMVCLQPTRRDFIELMKT